MEGSVSKRCGCRDAATGGKLGERCPKLKRSDHGAWWARYDEPQLGASSRRRQPTLGPFPTRAAAEAALVETLSKINTGRYVHTDRTLTVAVDFQRWHAGRLRLKGSTRRNDDELAALYIVPGLGHLHPADVREHHIEQLYAAMRQIGRTSGDKPSPMLGRLLAARSDTPQARRPLGRARIRRVHAVIHAYLNSAVRRGTISRNPASNVELESSRASRPLVWTPARVEHWRRTGRRPARSMVWTPEQAGAFLDLATTDRLYPLFHLVAHRGLRRGEALGLPWTDVDLDDGLLAVRDTLVDMNDIGDDYEGFDDPKTPAGDRVLSLDTHTVAVLRAWQARQAEERADWGTAWVDSGRVFTRENGQPLNPGTVSQHFDRLVQRAAGSTLRCTATTHTGQQCHRLAVLDTDGHPRCGLRRHRGNHSQPLPAARSGLPPIRFHDLRHTAASLTYRVTRDLKLVSELLGHSSIKITGDVYTNIFADVDRDAAEAVARLIPRATPTSRAHPVHTRGAPSTSQEIELGKSPGQEGWS